MRDEIYQTKTAIKEDLKFARNRLAIDDPRTISNRINHIARFVRNNEGHWIYSKDATRQSSNDIVDIYKRKDKYLYYICESNFEYIIEARDLFYNLNKKTRYDGKRGHVDSVACRIKDNLVGYYTEINTIEPNNLSKYEYFKNAIGTVYHSRYEEWQAILKITDLLVNRIFLPSQIEFHSTTALVILENMVDTYIEGKKPTEEDENRFLADVAKTNPDDKHELKRIISHQYPL